MNTNNPPQNALLGELQSIHNLLDEEAINDIPVLNDVIEQTSTSDNLASLKKIFSQDEKLADAYQPLCEQPRTNHAATDSTEADIRENKEKTTKAVAPEEEQSDMFPTLDDYMGTACPLPQSGEPFEVEPLIQNIIDEAVPAFEAQLRKRLQSCAPEIIRQLAAQYASQ
jgi:hypothetical protein